MTSARDRMFHWVEVRAYCHATEEEEKVLAAMRTVLPGAEAKREALAGHFGNPLVRLAARAENAPVIKEAWRRIVAALGKDEVARDLEDRIDEDLVYHLRLDKQAAFLGRIERSASGDILDLRAKVAAYPAKREVALRVVREFVEAL